MKGGHSREALATLPRRARATLSATLILFSTPAAGADLRSVYELALANDPGFRAALAGYQATQQQLPQARAAFLPRLSATASRHRNDEEIATEAFIFSRPPGRASYYSDEYELTLRQPIYDKTLWANLAEAKAQVRRAEAAYQGARQDLILRVTEAYLEVLLAQDTLALAEAEKNALARNLETAEGRRKAGSGTIIEVHEARARFQVAAARVIEATNRLNDSREALRAISGRLPGILAGLRDSVAFTPPDPPDVPYWIESALRQNPELRAAAEGVAVARQEIERSRAARLPTLNAIGNHSRRDADASIPGPGVRADNTSIGLRLDVPIYQGGAVSARIDETIHRYEAARRTLQAQRRAVERSTRAAFQGVTSSLARIEALEHAIIAADSALAAKRDGRSFGLYTTLDVLDATRDLFQAKRDHAEARHSYLMGLLRLKNAAGTLNEDDITAINALLEQ